MLLAETIAIGGSGLVGLLIVVILILVVLRLLGVL